MESLLDQRTVIALGLVSVAALILIAAAPDRTKPPFGDIDTVVSNQETLVVCPQGAPSCHFSQIQDAIDAAPEGTTIVIKSGTYEENVIVRKSLTLQAAEGEHVIVKSATARFPTLLLVSGWYPIHVEVGGIALQPARQHQGNGIEIMGTVAARLERNTFDDYEFAILVVGKEAERGPSKLPLVITGNTIHDSAIMVRSSASVEISKNSIKPKVDPETTVSYGGVIVIEASGGVTVSENLIEWGGGVMISQSSIITMERNIKCVGCSCNAGVVGRADWQSYHPARALWLSSREPRGHSSMREESHSRQSARRLPSTVSYYIFLRPAQA